VTGALALFLLAALLMAAGQLILARTTWTHRAPRLGIVTWQALTGAVVLSLVLGCLAMVMPGLSAASTVSEVLRACLIELRRQDSSFAGALVSFLGITASLLLIGRIVHAQARSVLTVVRSRRRQRAGLEAVARRAANGVHHVDNSVAAVYCVPGRRWSRVPDAVVVTRAAREVLTPTQLDLVLRHEHAHLRSRHDRPIRRAQALADAFGWVPFFRLAADQIACLAEMHADDAVPGGGDRLDLADALCRLASAPSAAVGAGGLAATGSSTMLRAQRLLHPQAPLKTPAIALVAAAIVAISIAPATLALVPNGIGLAHDCCTTEVSSADSRVDLALHVHH